MFVAMISGLSSLGILSGSGAQMNGLLTLMPVLVGVLTLSGSIHFINYFKDALKSSGWQKAIRIAFLLALRPCTLSLLTTALAIASLGIANIEAVRLFGTYTVISLIVSWFLVLYVLPAWLYVLEPISIARFLPKANSEWTWVPDALWRNPWQRHFGLFTITATLVFLGWGLRKTQSSLESESLFKKDNPINVSAHWFEQELTGRDALEVQVVLKQSREKNYQELDSVWSIQKAVREHQDVKASFSAYNLFGPVPRGFRIEQIVRRQRIEEELDGLLGNRGQKFRVLDGDQPIWKVRLALHDIRPDEYEQLITELDQLAQSAAESDGNIQSVSFTGMVYLASYSQQKLFDELVRSFGLAFLLVTPIMMIVLRSFTAGLLAMIPNVAPTLCLFGAMGWSSQPLSIGTILTATVGLGIAVDDTPSLPLLVSDRARFGSFFTNIEYRYQVLSADDSNFNDLRDQFVDVLPCRVRSRSSVCRQYRDPAGPGVGIRPDLLTDVIGLAIGNRIPRSSQIRPGTGYSPTGKSLSASHRV